MTVRRNRPRAHILSAQFDRRPQRLSIALYGQRAGSLCEWLQCWNECENGVLDTNLSRKIHIDPTTFAFPCIYSQLFGTDDETEEQELDKAVANGEDGGCRESNFHRNYVSPTDVSLFCMQQTKSTTCARKRAKCAISVRVCPKRARPSGSSTRCTKLISSDFLVWRRCGPVARSQRR